MATARAMLERRRASRVKTRIPVTVISPQGLSGVASQDHSVETLAVSRTGALLRVPFSPELGSRIEVHHGVSQEKREFRVVQVKPLKNDGLYELGLEMLYPARNFWGIKFPDE
jgi:hypothetical protein